MSTISQKKEVSGIFSRQTLVIGAVLMTAIATGWLIYFVLSSVEIDALPILAGVIAFAWVIYQRLSADSAFPVQIDGGNSRRHRVRNSDAPITVAETPPRASEQSRV